MKMSQPRVCLMFALTTFATLGHCPRALAQTATDRSGTLSEPEQNEARERYSRGMRLVGEGNYQAALIEMQRAYTLNPSYKILYNLGQIYLHLNDYAAAQTNFQRYLAEGGTDVPAGRMTEVSQELAKIRPRVATVELEVRGDGAEVLLDDAVIGRSPMRKTVFVNAGKHKFSAVRAGAEPVTRVLPLAGEDKVVLELDVSNGAAAKKLEGHKEPDDVMTRTEAGKRPMPKEGQETPSERSYLWLGWTVTALFGAGAAVSAYVTTREASDLKTARESPTMTRQSLDDHERATFRAALVTDLLLGATLVAGGTSLYFSLTSGSKPSSEKSGANLALTVRPSGMWLDGSF